MVESFQGLCKGHVTTLQSMSLSQHWLLSGCHYSLVTDAGGTDGRKQMRHQKGKVHPETETFQVYPGSMFYPQIADTQCC